MFTSKNLPPKDEGERGRRKRKSNSPIIVK